MAAFLCVLRHWVTKTSAICFLKPGYKRSNHANIKEVQEDSNNPADLSVVWYNDICHQMIEIWDFVCHSYHVTYPFSNSGVLGHFGQGYKSMTRAVLWQHWILYNCCNISLLIFEVFNLLDYQKTDFLVINQFFRKCIFSQYILYHNDSNLRIQW